MNTQDRQAYKQTLIYEIISIQNNINKVAGKSLKVIILVLITWADFYNPFKLSSLLQSFINEVINKIFINSVHSNWATDWTNKKKGQPKDKRPTYLRINQSQH